MDSIGSGPHVDRSTDHLRQRWILVGILAFAAVLRVWGYRFGLPNTVTRPDENTVVGTAARFMLLRTFDPGFFAYPTLYIYVLGGLYATGCAGTVLARLFPSVGACVAAWPEDWSRLFLAARIVTAAAGVGTVAAVVAIGRRLHPAAGIIAGAFLAVAFLHVRDSHYGVTDVPMTSLLVVTVLLILRAHEEPSLRRFVAAGVAGGFAASTKYNAVFVGASAVVSQVLAWTAPRQREPVRHTRLLAFTIAAAVAFLIGTPYAVLAPLRVWHDARIESQHLLDAHAGVLLGPGWRYHALVTLPLGLGWPLFLAGVAGMLVAFVRNLRLAALIFVFPLLYYIFAGRGYTVFTRYMIPMVPFLCLSAGVLVAWVSELAARRTRILGGLTAAALVVVCATPTAIKAMAFDRVLTRTDSRVLAAEWFVEHARHDSAILVVCSPYGGPQLWTRGQPLPFQVLNWNEEARRIVGGVRPDFILLEQSGLWHYSVFPEQLRPVLREYDLRHVIRTLDPGTPHVYDQQDAFYLPFDGFAHVVRPGPTLFIYEKRERSL